MKLNLQLLLVLSCLILSCNIEPVNSEGDLSETQDEPTDGILLEKIIHDKGTPNEYTETFNYNGNKLMSVVGTDGSEEWKNVYTYDNNDNLVKDDFFDADGHIASVVLEYNSNGKVASYIENFFEPSGLSDRKYKKIFTYNNDGTITNKVYVDYLNSGFELKWTETITLNEKNIIKILDDDGYKIDYTYDNKNNAYKNIHAIEVLNILSENEFGSIIYGNTHNVIKYVESDSSISDNYNDTIEYTYNEKNYPKTAIYTSKYGNQIEEVYTMDYFYK
ncbi:hypothetical protein [Aestuariivivens insulae]|uniref:hypothetical protein n=1 Tax=Aestuariivivens insulae TaxID=1621988 RepID=UPI001F591F72|nr:hypothetical protein [Aestuariivivens insulae]